MPHSPRAKKGPKKKGAATVKTTEAKNRPVLAKTADPEPSGTPPSVAVKTETNDVSLAPEVVPPVIPMMDPIIEDLPVMTPGARVRTIPLDLHFSSMATFKSFEHNPDRANPGMTLQFKQANNTNLHEIAHAFRACAERHMLALSCGERDIVRIADLWGSRRFQKHAAKVGIAVQLADLGRKYEQDSLREDVEERIDLAHLGEFDAITVTDVYELTPAVLHLALEHAPVIYACVRRFDSAFEADTEVGGAVYMVSENGLVKAQKDRLVNFRDHSSQEWLFAESDEFAINVYAKHGPFYVLGIKHGRWPGLPPSRSVTREKVRSNQYALVEQWWYAYFGTPPAWLTNICAQYSNELVHRVIAESVLEKCRNRPLNGSNQDDVRARVHEVCSMIPWADSVRWEPRWASVWNDMLRGTVLYVQDRMLARGQLQLNVRLNNAPYEAAARLARQHLPPGSDPVRAARLAFRVQLAKQAAKAILTASALIGVGVLSYKIVIVSTHAVVDISGPAFGGVSQTLTSAGQTGKGLVEQVALGGAHLLALSELAGRVVFDVVKKCVSLMWSRFRGFIEERARMATARTALRAWEERQRVLWTMHTYSYPLALYTKAPVVSAMIESGIVILYPPAAAVIGLIELVRNRSIVPFVVHCLSGLSCIYPIGQVLWPVVHVAWNYFHTAEPLEADFAVWREREATSGESNGPLPPGFKVPTPPPTFVEVPKGLVGRLTVSDPTSGWTRDVVTNDEAREVFRHLEVKEQHLRDAGLDPGCWPLLAGAHTPFAMYKTPLMCYMAAYTRLHNPPHSEVRYGKLVKCDFPAWNELTKTMYVSGLFPHASDTIGGVAEYLDTAPTKSADSIRSGFSARQEDALATKAQKMNPKVDEANWTANKVRAIVAVSSDIQSMLAGEAHRLGLTFKAMRTGREVILPNLSYWLYYGPGMTGADLDDLVKTLPDNCHVVCGDDSFYKVKGIFYENDFSKFDSSRCKSGVTSTSLMLNYSGMHPVAAFELQQLSNFSYVSGSHGVVIRGSVESTFPTGVVVTTLANSHTNASAGFAFFSRLSEGCSVDEAVGWVSAELGLVQKFKETRTLYGTTFLKGWWVPTLSSGDVWVNLPSAVCKASKLLKDPSVVFKRTCKGDPVLAYRQAAGAIAASWQVGRSYPIFGAFLSVCDRYGREIENPGSFAHLLLDDYAFKARATRHEDFDVEAIYAIMADRYGCSVEQIHECDQLIRQIPTLPWLFDHPVLTALYRVDYM